MFCPKCGNEIPDNSEFCMKCGAKIETVAMRSTNDLSDNIDSRSTNSNDNKAVKTGSLFNAKKLYVAVVAGVVIIAFIKVLLSGVLPSGKVSIGKYAESKDLAVIGSTITDDYYTVVAVENIGEKTVRDYEVAYLGFDSSGNAIKLGRDTWYKTGSVSSANILPGESYGLDMRFYGIVSDAKYTAAAISEITFTDGSTWTAKNIDSWAEKTISAFSVDKYKKNIEDMRTLSLKAENNPYVRVTNSIKYNDNRFSNSDDLDVEYKNIGDKDIRSVDAIVMEYDNNGYAVNVSPYSFVTINCRRFSSPDANITVGNSSSGNLSLFFAPNCESYKILVTDIEFMDGTKWTNNYAFQWILYNENMEKD